MGGTERCVPWEAIKKRKKKNLRKKQGPECDRLKCHTREQIGKQRNAMRSEIQETHSD